MKKTKLLAVMVAFFLAALLTMAQSVPQLINYQGRLTNPAGQPLDAATVDLTFSFYGTQTGSTAFLTILQENVLVTAGVYNVLLGSGTITPGTESSLADVFQKHQEVWLGVKVDTDPEMTPRQRITSVPYALAVDLKSINDFVNAQDYDGDSFNKPIYGGDDCDDSNAAVYKGAPEICDGVDNQCPGDMGYGFIDEGCPGVCTDMDGDDYYPVAGCGTPVDCNDMDSSIYPGAPEICDTKDNQCPGNLGYGFIDEGCPGVCTDMDADGYYFEGWCGPPADCDDHDPNNWASCASCMDFDLDNYYAGCDVYITIEGPDCNDADFDIYPRAPEICDSKDNQCPGELGYGFIDENCPGVCTDMDADAAYLEPWCTPLDCNDLDNTIRPGAPEICDAQDNQCPGDIGYGFIDEGCPGVCTDKDGDVAYFEPWCTPMDCNDLDITISPGAPEVCDAKDNQCPGDPGYGQIDEGLGCPAYNWTRRMGGSAQESGTSIAVDGSGNVYLTGNFGGTVNFAENWGSSNPKTAAGYNDIFVTRINANGTYGWTRRMGGLNDNYGFGIAVDGSGNVYLTGYFYDMVNFAEDWGGSDLKISAGGYYDRDIFVTRINANGSYGWTRRIGGTGGDGDIGRGITVDGSGNVYLTGYFYDTVNFAEDWSGSDYKTSTGNSDIFVTRINADSSYGWTRIIGGSDIDNGYGISVDDSGNVYLTGYFSDTVNFAADWSGSDSKTAAGYLDIFVTRINANGSYGWTKRIGGSFFEYGNSITVDGSGNVYLTGMFMFPINFAEDWSGSDSKNSAGDYDIFVTRINADGSYGWTRRMGGPNYDAGYGITVDGSGNVYLTGRYAGRVNFAADWGSRDFKTSVRFDDIFLTRIDSDGSYGWTEIMGGSFVDRGYGITMGGSGNLYLTGYFMDTVNFAANWGGSDSRTSAGDMDIFVTRITQP